MTFLVRTSSSTYNDVANNHVSAACQYCLQEDGQTDYFKKQYNKAYCLHMSTIQPISDRACWEMWPSHQQVGAIAQDMANINSGIHYHITNMLKGGNKSHSVALLQIFQAFAQKVNDVAAAEINENKKDNVFAGSKSNQHLNLDNL